MRLRSEDVAEFDLSAPACKKDYRMVVLRKNLSVEKGDKDALRRHALLLLHHQRPWPASAEQIVFWANDRCDQENLIAQLKEAACRP